MPMENDFSQPYLCNASVIAGNRCRFFNSPGPASPFSEEHECHVPERESHGRLEQQPGLREVYQLDLRQSLPHLARTVRLRSASFLRTVLHSKSHLTASVCYLLPDVVNTVSSASDLATTFFSIPDQYKPDVRPCQRCRLSIL